MECLNTIVKQDIVADCGTPPTLFLTDFVGLLHLRAPDTNSNDVFLAHIEADCVVDVASAANYADYKLAPGETLDIWIDCANVNWWAGGLGHAQLKWTIYGKQGKQGL